MELCSFLYFRKKKLLASVWLWVQCCCVHVVGLRFAQVENLCHFMLNLVSLRLHSKP